MIDSRKRDLDGMKGERKKMIRKWLPSSRSDENERTRNSSRQHNSRNVIVSINVSVFPFAFVTLCFLLLETVEVGRSR